MAGWLRCAVVLTALLAVCSGERKLSHPAFTGFQAQSLVLKILYW